VLSLALLGVALDVLVVAWGRALLHVALDIVITGSRTLLHVALDVIVAGCTLLHVALDIVVVSTEALLDAFAAHASKDAVTATRLVLVTHLETSLCCGVLIWHRQCRE
jgi:hypothetical protein